MWTQLRKEAAQQEYFNHYGIFFSSSIVKAGPLFQIPEQNDLISSIDCSKALGTNSSALSPPKEVHKQKLLAQMASRRNTLD